LKIENFIFGTFASSYASKTSNFLVANGGWFEKLFAVPTPVRLVNPYDELPACIY
jgi:hypothetical protein